MATYRPPPPALSLGNTRLPPQAKIRLCIKVGRGQGDGDIGMRVWGLGTWGREAKDLGTSSIGRGDAGR